MAKKKSLPVRSKDVPATMGMLHMVRDELKSDIRSLEHKMDGGFTKVRGEMSTLSTDLRSEMSAVRSELTSDMSSLRTELKTDMSMLRTELKTEMSALRTELKTEMSALKSELKSEMEKVTAKVHHMSLLAEEQLAQNRIVMDGLTGLFGRQERVETRIDDFERTLSDLKR